ncbi:hypothetical protein [Geodermatophilus marinus]|uniref:hypothetical protein n=1 Tax=Geodermatophilus sp. LHW52908 TaxID=2303986 RepID=UPI0011C1BD0E|nr:hypothetical protein [Geodermatophilus sp. LHW52908]
MAENSPDLPGPGRPALPPQPAVVESVRAALAPYPWRGLTGPVVAALAVAAADVARGAGAVGPPGDPLLRRDPRVGALVAALGPDPGWRRLTVEEFSRRLAEALAGVEERALWLDVELGWLLDRPA